MLIVDDEKSLRDMLQLLFHKQGFEATTAANYTEGVAAAIRLEPRRHPLRHQDARRERPGPAFPRPRRGPSDARHHDHGPHLDRGRDPGPQARRHRLHPEAVQQRRARDDRPPGARGEAAPGREPLPAPGARRQVQLRQHHRPRQPDAGDLPDDRADRQGLHDRARDGRERHRQGSHRAADPFLVDPQGQEVRLDQLRRAARDAPRVRALRPRAGRLHRRRAREARSLPGGRRRHALPRRDLRDDAHDAGQAAPRHPGEGGPPRRRQRGDRRSTSASSPRPTRT